MTKEEAPVNTFPQDLGTDLKRRTDALLARDFLYDNPESFRAGVMAALRMLEERDTRSEHAAVAAGHGARV